MMIPGRLKDTTLGDVFGTLHRARATGYLELVERGYYAGRAHLIQFEEGNIVAVQSPLGPRLGELLQLRPSSSPLPSGQAWLSQGLISQEELRQALRTQLQQRLEQLFQFQDADLRFRIPRPRQEDPTAPPALQREEFLHNRPRKRRQAPAQSFLSSHSLEAFRLLGLRPGASQSEIQQAFRRLAQNAHPDRHRLASVEERQQLMKRFAELSRAYHTLIA